MYQELNSYLVEGCLRKFDQLDMLKFQLSKNCGTDDDDFVREAWLVERSMLHSPYALFALFGAYIFTQKDLKCKTRTETLKVLFDISLPQESL